jgi:hypothetical protein
MPVYPAKLWFLDYYGRETTRSYQVEATDFAAAETQLAAFVPLVQAVTMLSVYKARLSSDQLFAGVVSANANRDEGQTITAEIGGIVGKKGSIQLPGPILTIRNSDGTINIDDAAMLALEAGFPAQGVLVSDGEEVDSFVKSTLDK